MIRRLTYTLVLLLAATVGRAQSYRSVSVWHDGKSSDYSMITLDSMTVSESDSILHLFSTSSEKELPVDDIDSVTFNLPSIASTNKRRPSELKAEFSTVEVDKTAYKPLDMKNPLMGHKFGADPFGMVAGGRLYVYMTDDR